MRRIIALAVALPTILVFSLASFTSVASADNRAQRLEWNGSVMNAAGTGLSIPVSCSTVITSSGNATQVCHGEGAVNTTGETVFHSGESTGLNCYPKHPIVPYPGGTPSPNWHEVITPSGQVTFVCKMP